MLNNVLTVEEGKADSHKGRGWEQFTDAVVRAINRRGNVSFENHKSTLSLIDHRFNIFDVHLKAKELLFYFGASQRKQKGRVLTVNQIWSFARRTLPLWVQLKHQRRSLDRSASVWRMTTLLQRECLESIGIYNEELEREGY